MALRKKEYNKIIDGTIRLTEIEDIAEYFQRQYRIHHTDSPNFINDLKEAIDFYSPNGSYPGDIMRSFHLFLEMITPEQTTKAAEGEEIQQKIVWNGELKQLVELIDQLEKNGWITIADDNYASCARILIACFDLTKTKRKETSDTYNSLYQLLKPRSLEDKVYTKRYKKSFASILPCIPKK